MRLPKKMTRFTHREWHWTNHGENLFSLSREELFIYQALLKEVP